MPDTEAVALTRERKVIVIAGPNGAGKTTFAREFLPNEGRCTTFVNADLIAAGLSPFAPDAAAFRAGRLMLTEIQRQVRRGAGFAFETTLSGHRYAWLIPEWQSAGYCVALVFLRLSSPELAIARVRQRVKNGGHHVPEKVIRRRFAAGLRHFENLYKPIVNSWVLYDNTDSSLRMLDQGRKS